MKAKVTSPIIKVTLESETPFNMESYTKDNQLVIVLTRGALEPKAPVLPGQTDIFGKVIE